MSDYPPAPPSDQQHYNGVYSTSTGTPFNNPDQTVFPQSEHAGLNIPTSAQSIQFLARELQRQSTLEEQQKQLILQHHDTSDAQQQRRQVEHENGKTQQRRSSSGDSPNPQSQMLEDSPDQSQKSNRLRKACDSCSIRKVKCDESGPPCKGCKALDIPCTFDRPSRRRGPPNRHAEAVKRRRLEDPDGLDPRDVPATSPPSSPAHATQALAAISSRSHGFSAESICPAETIELLINEFFTYVHPLCPFPHEPSFREAWKRREDLNNRSFLALLSSMIAALVASFPRKPRLHLKAQRRERSYPNHMSLVLRCQHICARARGPGYLENENLNVYDAATSYFLALTGMYTFRWRQGRLYFGECLTILRTLGLHKAKEQTSMQLGFLPAAVGSHESDISSAQEQKVDNITREMGRRIFWTIFVSVRAMAQLGAQFGELVIPPPTRTEPYPPLPVELDDFCIFPERLENQPPSLVPMIAGFNANVRIYSSYNALSTMEMAWGIEAIVDWDRQKRVLHESLHRCKEAVDALPVELKVATDLADSSESDKHTNGVAHARKKQTARDPAQSLITPSRKDVQQTPQERRRTQYEIQKANIYASSLATRSYLVQKYWNLVEAHSRAQAQTTGSTPISPSERVSAKGMAGVPPQPPTGDFTTIEQEMREERESIVKDLLTVLSSIDQVNMEPNGDSFTMKIRLIASTLLEVPDQHKGQLAIQAQEYLSAFVNILMKLERVSPENSDTDAPEDDDAELKAWADLREYQVKFAQQGGLLGFS